MTKTGAAIVFALIGVGIGLAIAKLVPTPATCADQLISVNPKGSSNQLGDRDVCKGSGHLVSWLSTNRAPIKVEWVSIVPSTAPFPYTLDCNDYTNAFCFSGPMSLNAAEGSAATYKVTFQTGQSFNGRIIIQK